MITEEKATKLQQLLKLMDESITKADFVKSFASVVDFVKQMQSRNDSEIKAMQENIRLLSEKVQSDNSADIETVKQECRNLFSTQLKLIQAKIDSVTNGSDGKDGKNGIDGINGKNGKDGSSDTPGQVRDKLETLKGEDRIDKSAVKGLDEQIQKVSGSGLKLFGGMGGFKLYVDGSKKGTAKTLNLIPGTGVTFTYDYASGRNDIVINATAGGGGFTKLTATGLVNSSNAAFTFISKPTYIVSDGAFYTENIGWTWNAGTLTATLTIPPNSDIYGFS